MIALLLGVFLSKPIKKHHFSVENAVILEAFDRAFDAPSLKLKFI
jgi:hypothetical protein